MSESEKKTVYVSNDDVSPEEELNQSLPTENDDHSDKNSDSNYGEQEIPVEDLTNFLPSTLDSDNDERSGGYASDDVSSINTDEILKVDPLYLRLTKFLHDDDGESVANNLKKINHQLQLLNTNLSNANANSTRL
jgi:hypothetical protein